MRKATAISAGLHAAVLLWATLSFSGKSFNVTPAESLPVDFISEKDFSEMTKGVKDAPKVEAPKPLVEKKSEEPPKPIEEVKPKVTEKKELQAAKEASPPPEPQPPKPDQIAEKLKQQDESKQAKTEQLDEAIGVAGGDLGAPGLRHPPARSGAYSAASAGVSQGAAAPAEGPMPSSGEDEG